MQITLQLQLCRVNDCRLYGRCIRVLQAKLKQAGNQLDVMSDFETCSLTNIHTVGVHANETFLPIENLKGIILGGPGPTKLILRKRLSELSVEEQNSGCNRHAYVEEQGVKEIVDKALKSCVKSATSRKKRLCRNSSMSRPRYRLDNVRRSEVRRLLQNGAVRTVLMSEDLDLVGHGKMRRMRLRRTAHS